MGLKAFLGIALAASFGFASFSFAVTNIKDPAGKTVLIVDGDNVKNDSATVMTISDDNIKDASGKQVLYINGDNIRDEPNGKILLIIDGRHIKREVGGTNLLYVDGKNLMRGDRSGKPLYRFDGDDLSSQQRMAVLYVLMPEIFGASKEADAKLIASQTKSAAESDAASTKDFAAGTFAIDAYTSNDASTIKQGTVTITKVGEVLDMEFHITHGDAMQGVAVQRGDEVWAAVGPAATVGLAVYKVQGGNLSGTWYNATGKPESFGSENLSGADPLGGEYKITDAKAPFTLAPYVGTLTLTAAGKKFDGVAPIFMAAWDLGGYKARGVGFSEPNTLAVATSSAAEFSIVRFKIDIKEGYLNGQFYSAGKVAGIWSLKKK